MFSPSLSVIRQSGWGAAIAFVLGLIVSALGCRNHDPIGADRCAAFKPGSMPQRTGTYTCQWQTAQMDRAEAGKYVIYPSEWYMGGKTLGPDGRYHLKRMAHDLPHVPYPVVVASADDDELNEARREAVVGQLANAGFEDADQRVIVDRPEGEGLSGPEAARFGANRMFGRPPGGFGGGAGGGGGGLGGGGGGLGGGGMGGGGFGGGGMGGGMGFF